MATNLRSSDRRSVTILLLAADLLLLLALIYWILLLGQLPSSSEIRRSSSSRGTVVLSTDGVELAKYRDKYQEWVSLERISMHVPAALIATEDHRFFAHHGIDVRRTMGSVLQTLRGNRQGGSTITMQLARNGFPDLYDDTAITRKIKEWIVALRIEGVYSKKEILELYLNAVPFMYNAFGIEAGAQTYFQKPSKELRVDEAAILVGMLKGTSYYNPVRHPERAHERRNVVLAQMVEHGDLAVSTFEDIEHRRTRIRFRRLAPSRSLAPHFTAYVRQWLSEWAHENGYDLENDGLTIRTTLDSRVQRIAENALREVADDLQVVADVEWSSPSVPSASADVEAYRTRRRAVQPFSFFWATNSELLHRLIRETQQFEKLANDGRSESEALEILQQNESFVDSVKTAAQRLEAALTVTDPATGHVLAWVGGRDFAKNQYDHAAVAKRQPGSTFKPIVYAAALENGYSPSDQLRDEKVVYTDPESGRTWSPADVEPPSGARMSLANALAYSKNRITAQLVLAIGADRVIRYAHEMGIQSDLDAFPSIGLGTSEISLLELVSAYSVFANQGTYKEPLFVTGIEGEGRRPLEQFAQEERRALEPATAEEITGMLKRVVDYGTAAGLREYAGDDDLAGKTGTSQDGADGWFILLSPDLVAGAWVGFDAPAISFRSDYWGQGAHTALPIVGTFYQRLQEDDRVAAPGEADRKVR